MKKRSLLLSLVLLSHCSPLPSLSPSSLKILQEKQTQLDFTIESDSSNQTFNIKVIGEGYLRFFSKKSAKNQFLKEATLRFNDKFQAVLVSNSDWLIQPTIQALVDEGQVANIEHLKLCKNGKILYKRAEKFEFMSILSLVVFPDSSDDHDFLYTNRQFIESRPIGESEDVDCQDKT